LQQINKKEEIAAMVYYIGCDAHKKYSVFVTIDGGGKVSPPDRVVHDREVYRKYLNLLPAGSRIAIESVGNWYWMIEEMEKAGHRPVLVNAGKAKLMMGNINKTDKLDAKGLAQLDLNKSLPAVWIPPAELRDQRELSRMRMAMTQVRTKFKNRIQSTLAKYAITLDDEVSDVFGKKGRLLLSEAIKELPPETRLSVEEELKLLDYVMGQIEQIEKRVHKVVEMTPEMKLLKTLPGVGDILAIIIALEIGDIDRFPTAEKLASYAGTVPRVKSSGGKTYYGRVRPDVNRYLKWAFIEAANSISLHQSRMEGRHVVELLRKVQKHKGHPKAMSAVARHLAEAAYVVLKYHAPYHEPRRHQAVSSSQGYARVSHEM
jgi:transposase